MKKKKTGGFEKYLMETLSKDIESREIFLNYFYEQPLSTQLSLLRKYQGLSQVMLANKVKMPQPAIARIEKSESNPRMETIQKVSQGLEVRPILVSDKLLPIFVQHKMLHEGDIFFSKIVFGK